MCLDAVEAVTYSASQGWLTELYTFTMLPLEIADVMAFETTPAFGCVVSVIALRVTPGSFNLASAFNLRPDCSNYRIPSQGRETACYKYDRCVKESNSRNHQKGSCCHGARVCLGNDKSMVKQGKGHPILLPHHHQPQQLQSEESCENSAPVSPGLCMFR